MTPTYLLGSVPRKRRLLYGNTGSLTLTMKYTQPHYSLLYEQLLS